MAEPKFVPKPGQVDYTNIRYAPVVNVVVAHGGKILLVKRSADMRLYPGYWNNIAGFLDDDRDVKDKVCEELYEELGLSKSDVVKLTIARPLCQEAPEYNKTWLVIPVLANVKTANFKLDWEAAEAKWFVPNETRSLKLLPGFAEVLAQFF
ncbi:MAG TPA: NUDIX domain-containing protein [Candidatus Saccharimonadales bacterium]|jgi:NADH pyrophosphatase NudC (nudix superfamily)